MAHRDARLPRGGEDPVGDQAGAGRGHARGALALLVTKRGGAPALGLLVGQAYTSRGSRRGMIWTVTARRPAPAQRFAQLAGGAGGARGRRACRERRVHAQGLGIELEPEADGAERGGVVGEGQHVAPGAGGALGIGLGVGVALRDPQMPPARQPNLGRLDGGRASFPGMPSTTCSGLTWRTTSRRSSPA